jgi:hypothetical protein
MNLMTVFKIKLLALWNGVILFLWNMTGEYQNKNFILFPLQTKPALKFCSTCKRLKSLNQFNKYPWNTYFFRTYCKSCEHDKDEKRKALSEKLKQKYMAQGLSKSFIKQLIIKKLFLRQYKNAKPSYFEDMFTV